VNDAGTLRLTVQRFEGLRVILVAADRRVIETVAARLPLGARQGSALLVPTDHHGRPDWSRAVLNPVRD
jgi:hypothetical protein